MMKSNHDHVKCEPVLILFTSTLCMKEFLYFFYICQTFLVMIQVYFVVRNEDVVADRLFVSLVQLMNKITTLLNYSNLPCQEKLL